jgi:hypothetical protein
MVDHEFVARCEHCALQIGVDNQAALEEVVRQLLTADESCTDHQTHEFQQVRP